MLTINLLPEAYRKPTLSSIQQFPRSPLALLAVGLLVGVWGLLVVVQGSRQVRLRQLTARLQTLMPHKAEIDALKTSMNTLRDQQTVFQRLDRSRSQWASRLNAMSDVVPEGVWFTELSFDQQDKLILHGSALGLGGDEMARLSQFVQDLKADPAFSSVVRDIQIDSIQNVQEGQIELMEFSLTCELGERPTAAIR